jgi:hypothetical protein
MHQEVAACSEVFCDEKILSQHDLAMQRLVQELHLPFEEIQRCYIMAIVDILKKDQTVGNLPVLASRCVKECLQHR